MNLLDDLRHDFGAILVTLADVAAFVTPQGASTAPARTARLEQLRMARKRAGDAFPVSYPAGNRAFAHRLDELIDWLRARYADPTFNAVEILAWRLARVVNDVGAIASPEAARELLACLALARTEPELESLFAADQDAQGAAAELRALGAPTDERAVADPQGAGLIALMAQRADDIDDEQLLTMIREVDYAWQVCAGREPFADTIDATLAHTSLDLASARRRADSAIGEVILAALDAQPGQLVANLTCGEGSLLLDVARTTADGDEQRVQLVGRDRDPHVWRIAATRLRLHRVACDLGGGPVDAIADGLPDVRADRVVIDPDSTEVDVAGWLNAADQCLATNGRAVLTLAASTLLPLESTDPQLLAIEASLKVTGRLPTAVVVPAGTTASSRTPGLVVWIHDAGWAVESAATPCIAIIELGPIAGRSDLAPMLAELRGLLSSRPVDALGSTPAGLRYRVVGYDEIAAQGFDYRPSTWLDSTDAETIAANSRYAMQLTRELRRLIEPPGTLPTKRSRSAPSDSPDGVLSGEVTVEMRRGLRRLSDALERRR